MIVAGYSRAHARLRTPRAPGAWLVEQPGLVGFASMAALALLVLLLTTTRALANGGGLPLDDPTRVARLAVTIHKSETVRFKQPFAEALVASPEYADIAPLTDHAIYVIGKKVGQTRVTVLDKDKRLLSVIDVEIGYDVPGLRKALKENLPYAHVHVTSANG